MAKIGGAAVIHGPGKTIAEVIADLKEELKDFISTRVAMLRSEMGEKLNSLKTAAPLLITGLLLLITAWFVFTGFLICVIAQAFSATAWAYALSFLIVGFIYAIAGGIAASFAVKQLKQTNMKPERTMRVLEQDRMWLQTEAKSQL